MQFKIDNELFDTRTMVCLELDGIYLSIYLLPEHGLAFLQTFEEEHGVTVRKATAPQTEALLAEWTRTKLPDIPSYRRILGPLGRAKTPSHVTPRRLYSPARETNYSSTAE